MGRKPTGRPARKLTDEERARYAWQMWTPGVGEMGQRRLKGSRVLVSRVGGVGGAAAYYLAAAGVGHLVLAHAGNVRRDDLNRQILMTNRSIGRPRLDSAQRRLAELNPNVRFQNLYQNATAKNAKFLVESSDVVISAAPLFEERLALNAEVVRQKKVMVDCAMYEWDARITTIVPGGACLACQHPEPPAEWRREFPVFGAVAGTIGAMGAIEAIKVITGVGELLAGRMVACDFRSMAFRVLTVRRDPECVVCGVGFRG